MTDPKTLLAEDHNKKPREIVLGLDMLRFVTALWVAFSHGARFPVNRVIEPNNIPDKIILLLGNTSFNGIAAVAVFFVISGFCIHNGNVGKSEVDKLSFWARRLIRIGMPLLAVVIIASFLGSDYVASLNRVIWSDYCEIAYYLAYPLALPFIARFGIGRILAGSMAVSFIMLLFAPASIYLWEFDFAGTWLFCAPLWLVGCALAEWRHGLERISRPISVWFYRAGALGYCLASTILATHMGRFAIGYTWTIWLFGLFCLFWLAREIDHARVHQPLAILERFGLAGYSIYLTHKLVITLFENQFMSLSPLLYWIAILATIGVTSWLFYRFVEWPSHILARNSGRKVANRQKPRVIS